MAGSFAFGLTSAEEIGLLALLIYLNAGIAWYYYVCRKSEKYKHFETCVIGKPPRRPVAAPSPTTTTAQEGPSRFHSPCIKYALKRWGFVTASVLFFWVVHAIVRFTILIGTLFTHLGARIAVCSHIVYEMIWKRELWKARREWAKELAVDAPSSANGGKTTMSIV